MSRLAPFVVWRARRSKAVARRTSRIEKELLREIRAMPREHLAELLIRAERGEGGATRFERACRPGNR